MLAREACLSAEAVRTAVEAVGGRTLDLDFAAAAAAELSHAYRIAGYLLADAGEAQDAVQEACIRAWRGWPGLRDRARFRAWFGQILLNVCRTKLRQRGRLFNRTLGMLDVEALDVEATDPFRAALARDAIGRALPALSTELRLVVVLRYWGELTLAEIAERLEIPLGTVKSRHHAALQSLRRRIGPAEGDEP